MRNLTAALLMLASFLPASCSFEPRGSAVKEETAPSADATAEVSRFGQFRERTAYPGSCGEVYETNVRGSGCDVFYNVIRPSFNYGGRVCTDLVVRRINANCPVALKEQVGQVVRKCSGAAVVSLGTPENLIAQLVSNSEGLAAARAACQTGLTEATLKFERFESTYQAYEERLRNVPRDIMTGTLKGLMGRMIGQTGYPDLIKAVMGNVFSQLVDQAAGTGTFDPQAVVTNTLKGQLIGQLSEALIPHMPAGTPDVLRGALASMMVEETLAQAQRAAAAQGDSREIFAQTLKSLAERGTNTMIGAVSSLADQFGLGAVLATELHLLKAQVVTLGQSMAFFIRNAETTRVCNQYVDLFNTSGAYQAAMIASCADQAMATQE